MHHLPTPQFSRLVTILAFDLTSPALDSMILAWDHISTRFIKRLGSNRLVAGRIESIRLLAIHDAVHTVFKTGSGCIFNGRSSGSSIDAALAAAAQASHDILAGAFTDSEARRELALLLEESLLLIGNEEEQLAGARTGAESAATFSEAFGPLLQNLTDSAPSISASDERKPAQPISLRLAKNPKWNLDWQRSA